MTVALVNTYSAMVNGGLFAASTLTGQGTGGSLRRRVAQLLQVKSLRALREIATTLNGAASGSAALATQGRVPDAGGPTNDLGGKRTIETETLVDTNTAAGDITVLNADLFTVSSYVASPVANLDGNPLGLR